MRRKKVLFWDKFFESLFEILIGLYLILFILDILIRGFVTDTFPMGYLLWLIVAVGIAVVLFELKNKKTS